MVLVSPVLDFGWWQQPDYAPLPKVALLPSLAAAAMEEGGTFSEPALAGRRGLRRRRLRHRPAARRRGRGGGRPAGRAGHRADRHRPGGVERAAGRIDATSSCARRCATTAADQPLRRHRGEHRPDAGEPGRAGRRPGARRDDGAADQRDARPLPRHARWLPERPLPGAERRDQPGLGLGWRPRASPRRWARCAGCSRSIPSSACSSSHGYTDLVTPYFASELILRQLRRPANPPAGSARRTIGAGTCSTSARTPAVAARGCAPALRGADGLAHGSRSGHRLNVRLPELIGRRQNGHVEILRACIVQAIAEIEVPAARTIAVCGGKRETGRFDRREEDRESRSRAHRGTRSRSAPPLLRRDRTCRHGRGLGRLPTPQPGS